MNVRLDTVSAAEAISRESHTQRLAFDLAESDGATVTLPVTLVARIAVALHYNSREGTCARSDADALQFALAGMPAHDESTA